MITPPGFDPTTKYPVLFNVYHEPAAQTVVDSWGGGNFLWHLMLSQMGYIVMSVDNRGTPAPRGRAWRKAIYKKMGVLNPADQAAAAQVIAKWPFVDPQRLGVWGWSGGGSTTLNVMFRTPDVYKMGMAVAPGRASPATARSRGTPRARRASRACRGRRATRVTRVTRVTRATPVPRACPA